MLKLGSTGPEVGKLQERLRALGFDADGTFGPATRAAVTAFQESRGLLPDGIAGPITLAALEEGADPIADDSRLRSLDVNRSIRLSPRNYFQEVAPKSLIVLHHTAGASATSTINWWESQDSRIATAFVIERDGMIYEVFDPRHWAYHLGVRGVGSRLDRRSIGIELACEGPLQATEAGFRAFGRPFRGDVYEHPNVWRGQSRHFAAYTGEQVAAAARLVDELCDVFAVPRRTPSDHVAFDADLVDYRGVIGHHHVRADKTDLHPGFDWAHLIAEARLELTP